MAGTAPARFPASCLTRLGAKGLSAREIADYLGHERVSMTQDVYMARGTTGAAAAGAMDMLAPSESDG
jgi:integrase